MIVTATTAQPLSTVQRQRLTEKLTAITGKHIQLSNRIDASILGGIQLDYEGQRLEDTVSHRLDDIRSTGNLEAEAEEELQSALTVLFRHVYF